MKKQHFTPRNIDVLRLGAMGYCDKDIADKLDLAPESVKHYMVAARRKLGKFDRNMLPGIGLVLGIVSIADVCRAAMQFVQGPEDIEIRCFHEGAD